MARFLKSDPIGIDILILRHFRATRALAVNTLLLILFFALTTHARQFIDSQVLNRELLKQAFADTDNTTLNIFAHGKPGQMLINAHWLKKEEIISFLKDRLDETPHVRHVNILACEFAKGEEGREALDFLALHLPVTFSASTNITGRTGDWQLETGDPLDEGLTSFLARVYMFDLQAVEPFGCHPDFYQSLQEAGTVRNAQMVDMHMDGSSTNIGTRSDYPYNAIGYNIDDNFIYGALNDRTINSNQVVKVDKNGNVTATTLSNLPAGKYNAGDVSPDGVLIIKQGGANSTLYKIPIVEGVPTYPGTEGGALQLTTEGGADFPGFVISDLAIDNTGAFAYTVTDGTVANNGKRVLKINLTTGVTTVLGTATGIANGTIDGGPYLGSLFIDSGGKFYVFENSGVLYEVSTTDGSVIRTVNDNYETFNRNDGAFCRNAVLPVTLIGFSVSALEEGVGLKWSTADETNFDYFEIQQTRSINKGFEAVAKVSGGKNEYVYNLGSLPKGNNYFRLKMVDLDATYAYSKIIVYNEKGEGEEFIAYPNPVDQNIFRIRQNRQLSNFALFNFSGQRVNVSVTADGDEYRFKVDDAVTTGTYVLKCNFEGNRIERKLVIR